MTETRSDKAGQRARDRAAEDAEYERRCEARLARIEANKDPFRAELEEKLKGEKDKHRVRDIGLKIQAIRAFERHQIRERGERTFLLMEKEANGRWESNMGAEIMVGYWSTLYVGGDIDCCTFAYGPKSVRSRIAWIGGTSDVGYYVAQKASIGRSSGDGLKIFDEQLAEVELRDMLEQHIQDLDLEEDDLVDHLRDATLDYPWPADPDDIGEDEPVNLREYLIHSAPSRHVQELQAFLDRHPGIDNEELMVPLKAWAEERSKKHLDEQAGDDPIVSAIHEILDEGIESGPWGRTRFVDTLHERLGYEFMEERFDIGMVVDQRVYYCWAAVRRLHQLLLEEEERNHDRDRDAEDREAAR